MENQDAQQVADQLYGYAANLLVNENKNAMEVRSTLVQKGLSEAGAATIVANLQDQITKAKKERANKDMLYGALWCVGGIVATAANIGFIFWGAILFGGIQFIKGAISAATSK